MSESFLPVLLALFLFFLIPFTFCVAILLVMGPRRQYLIRTPHAPSAPATRAAIGVTWNNPLDAVREGATISSWLQVPPNVLQQMGRSLSTSPQRPPHDPEAGIHLSEFYVGVGHLNALPVGRYRAQS
ncbi:hypothetical protein C8R47DRAFT_1111870 [Mycena vitilis]|nr:hypothetical protein C8R47DRAFT_1111870 [Mycena vitilis]